jgi:hypothetical protein
MIRKRIKKIKELVFLITVRQIWKLLCNLYHIIEEPFLTFKKLLVKDRDKSQIFLVLMVFLAPILVYFSARVFWDYYRFGGMVNGVGNLFLIASVIEFFLVVYLVYWVVRVIRGK